MEASVRAGFGPARYAREGRAWLVRRTRLQRPAALGGGDRIVLTTRVLDFRRARSLRRYELRQIEDPPAAAGLLAAYATTDWVYCDTRSGRPVSVPEAMKIALFGTADAPTKARAPRVTVPPVTAASTRRLHIAVSALDHMRHVNNAVWADLLEDAAFGLFSILGLGLDRMLEAGGALRIRSLDLEYLGEATVGDSIVIETWLGAAAPTIGGSADLIQTARCEDGRPLIRAASTWHWTTASPTLGGPPRAGPDAPRSRASKLRDNT